MLIWDIIVFLGRWPDGGASWRRQIASLQGRDGLRKKPARYRIVCVAPSSASERVHVSAFLFNLHILPHCNLVWPRIHAGLNSKFMLLSCFPALRLFAYTLCTCPCGGLLYHSSGKGTGLCCTGGGFSSSNPPTPQARIRFACLEAEVHHQLRPLVTACHL